MEEREIWTILGIEPIKDEEAVKRAYREKLVHVNPEDDPEGFKRLRSAYEKALEWINRPEEGEDNLSGPLKVWMDRVREAYGSFSKRTDPEVWRELLTDEVCVDLETGTEARNELLKFCMDHFRMPSKVFQVVDEELSLLNDMEELKELYPSDFLAYIKNKCTQEDWIDFKLFEGPDDADYDTYFSRFFEIRRNVEEGKMEGLEQLFEEARSTGIYHPYLGVSRAEALIQQEKPKEALEIILPLAERYPEDWWVLYIAGQAFWTDENWEEAHRYFEKVLTLDPDHYTARLREAQYLNKIGKAQEAKDAFTDLLDTAPNSSDVLEGLREANSRLIPEFQRQCEENPEDLSIRLKLGWCLLQNERYEEGRSLFQGIIPDEENEREYHSLTGRFDYNLDDPAKAEEHFAKWVELLKLEKPETEEEREKLPVRFGRAYSLLAAARRKLGGEDNDWYDKALEAIDEAIRYQEDLEYVQQRADLLLDAGRYEECVDTCDKILERDEGYFPAVVDRQDSYYHLHNAQNVIDDFYRAKEIYPYFPKIYELAADVFYIYRQYEDVMDIIRQADENEIKSLKLMSLKAKTLRFQADSREKFEEAHSYVETVLKKMKEEDAEKSEQADMMREAALCSMSLKDYERAQKEIDVALNLDMSSVESMWIKADIIYRTGDYEKALKLYQSCQKDVSDNANIYEDIANCYQELGDRDRAVENYEKALELNPEQPRVNNRLSSIYGELYDRREDQADFDKALSYADRQLELNPCAYYYIERGLLYLNASKYDEALKDFEKAYELEPDNPYAYNNAGNTRKLQGDYERAVELFKKALEFMEPGESTVFYGNLANCLQRMGRYQEAENAYRENIRQFPRNHTIKLELTDMLEAIGQPNRAIPILEDILKESGIKKEYYLMELADAYEIAGDVSAAISCCKKALKERNTYARAYRTLAEIYLYRKKNIKKAEAYVKKALDCEPEGTDQYMGGCRLMCQICSMRGDADGVREYLKKGLDAKIREYGSLEHYLEGKGYENARFYILGLMYYDGGDVETAASYFNRMKCGRLCRNCTCEDCWEYHVGQGLLAQADGDQERALEHFQKACALDCRDSELRYRIRNLE